MPKRYRLPAKDFQYVYKNGVREKGKYGMLIGVKGGSSTTPLFGFVVSKKIGNSVKRHRLTRMLRAIAQDCIKELNLHECNYRFEYIAFVFPESFNELKLEFCEQVKKICFK